jgi:hypothetical protein
VKTTQTLVTTIGMDILRTTEKVAVSDFQVPAFLGLAPEVL